MAAMSRVVGMICPGLHSVFLGFKMDFVERANGEPDLSYAVETVDERFNLVRVRFSGSGVRGTIEALRRREPVDQASCRELKTLVKADEFRGARALVIGGSRGLGALTARLIACGGGEVLLTYAVGRAEAEAVANDIESVGGRCRIAAFDALQPPAGQLADIGQITHLYYFATGKIFLRKLELFDRETFMRFCDFYITGFHNLIRYLQASGAPLRSIFYPSSIAVVDRPRDLTEYAMAKAASEVLCADLQVALPKIKIVTARLPALTTDQTPSMASDSGPSAVETMLPLVRQTQGTA